MTRDEARNQLINFERSLELPSLEAVELAIEALELYWHTGEPAEEGWYVTKEKFFDTEVYKIRECCLSESLNLPSYYFFANACSDEIIAWHKIPECKEKE